MRPTGASPPVELARRAEGLGVGEILLTSIDQDGTMDGYDLALIECVCEAVGVPVIACGGAGEPEHFVTAVEERRAPTRFPRLASFTSPASRPTISRQHMREAGLDVRL